MLPSWIKSASCSSLRSYRRAMDTTSRKLARTMCSLALTPSVTVLWSARLSRTPSVPMPRFNCASASNPSLMALPSRFSSSALSKSTCPISLRYIRTASGPVSLPIACLMRAHQCAFQANPVIPSQQHQPWLRYRALPAKCVHLGRRESHQDR